MKLNERLQINEIIENKDNGLSWDAALERVVDIEKKSYILKLAKIEKMRRIEEEQYIHSLS